MKCPECGEELPDYASFCSYCGADIEEIRKGKADMVLGYAPIGKRFVAFLVDIAFIGIFLGLLTMFMRVGFGLITTLVIAWFYFAYLESSERQATVGKRLFSLKVADEKLERISFGKASLRYILKIVSGLILGIGFIIAISSKQKQALHDRIIKTVVLYENKYNKEQIDDLSKY
jgi:uncharacterized RDD family membrane protein YckC